MSEILHVLMKINDQETFFDGKSYPHYEIGWKKGNVFHSWNGLKRNEDEIEEWEEI